eukprot:637807-Pyramimonas_sp.AAC.1
MRTEDCAKSCHACLDFAASLDSLAPTSNEFQKQRGKPFGILEAAHQTASCVPSHRLRRGKARHGLTWSRTPL